MSDHRRLDIWKAARTLGKRVHFVVAALPRDEQFRRGNQLIRAANSVRNNIAEGASGTSAQFAKALSHALGSANEAHDQLDDLDGVALLPEGDRDLLDAYLDLAAMIASFRKIVLRDIQKKKRGA